jgi:hypothetical protein
MSLLIAYAMFSLDVALATSDPVNGLARRAAPIGDPAPSNVESIFPLTRREKEIAYLWERIAYHQVKCLCALAKEVCLASHVSHFRK